MWKLKILCLCPVERDKFERLEHEFILDYDGGLYENEGPDDDQGLEVEEEGDLGLGEAYDYPGYTNISVNMIKRKKILSQFLFV